MTFQPPKQQSSERDTGLFPDPCKKTFWWSPYVEFPRLLKAPTVEPDSIDQSVDSAAAATASAQRDRRLSRSEEAMSWDGGVVLSLPGSTDQERLPRLPPKATYVPPHRRSPSDLGSDPVRADAASSVVKWRQKRAGALPVRQLPSQVQFAISPPPSLLLTGLRLRTHVLQVRTQTRGPNWLTSGKP